MNMILKLDKIDKKFGKVHALKKISLEIEEGITMALVGENGAGKSTLMKILTGAYTKDSGDVFLNGKKMEMKGTITAKESGIGQIYQRAEIIPELSIAENIFLGEVNSPCKGLMSWKNMFKKAKKLLDEYELDIDSEVKMKNLSVASCQLVSIVKVLQRNPKIIIFDEPTSVLSENEVDVLFNLIARLQEKNKTIIYISHRLDEVFKISNNIAIMRDGELVTVIENKNISNEDLIEHMLGRKLDTMYPKKNTIEKRNVILSLNNVSTDKIKNITFDLYESEILGMAGLVGSGRTEIARAIYGMDKIINGNISIMGEIVKIGAPNDVIKKGIFLAPEDRKGQGLVLGRSIRENITYSNIKMFSKCGLYNKKLELEHTKNLKDKINIKCPSVETISGDLSGGNQQKVVLAKALTSNPKILIIDEPTQGIDVGAKAEIYKMLNDLARQGMSIIVISSELDEVVGLCNRVIVVRNGSISGKVDNVTTENTRGILDLMYKDKIS